MLKPFVIFLIACFITAEARHTYPITFKTNTTVLFERNAFSDNYRLPESVFPRSYDLQLIPNLDEKSENAFTFNGSVKIELAVTTKVNNITLHCRNLKIDRNDVKLYKDEEEIKNFTLTFDSDLDFLHIDSSDLLEEGNYTLYIKYIGQLNNQLRGFYRSSYINAKGKRA